MKKGYFLFAIGLILLFVDAIAQPTNNQDGINVKLISLRQDTAFIRFEGKLKELMKTAKGKQSNYAAVKKLFSSNSTMLQGLKKRYNLGSAITSNGSQNKFSADKRPSLVGVVKGPTANIYSYTLNGPFSGTNINRGYAMAEEINRVGNKLSWINTYSYTPERSIKLGWAGYYHTAEITVPNNPLIIGVRLEFDYSFYTAGWDSDGGDLYTILGLWASEEFSSPAYSSLETSEIASALYPPGPVYKKAKQLYYRQFLNTVDFGYSDISKFVIEGYVLPGKNFTVKLAAGYTDASTMGYFGGYHYGEFELYRINVTFLKAGQQ